jgi:perosamine synthetase
MKIGKNKTNFILPLIDTSQALRLIKKTLAVNAPNEGDLTRTFERKISKLLNVKYVAATTSGTIAMFLALKALKINKGDEVLVPNLTFAATINAVNLAGAKPILVDINKETLLFDLKKLRKKINKKTKAILAVHISGRGSNIIELKKIANKNKLKLIEDAAEAFMSKNNNKSLGTFGDIGCFSFSPPKIFTTGQGGAVVTNSLKLYKEILQLKNQGRIGKTDGGEDTYASIGYNFKFTNLQSALGLSQLSNIKWRKKKLIENYKFYRKNLKESSNFKIFKFNLKKGELPLWTDTYCEKRNKLHNFLLKKGIECRYFWHPINYCKPYKQSFKSLENSKMLHGKLMWLPSSLNMKKAELFKICNLINQFNKKFNG